MVFSPAPQRLLLSMLQSRLLQFFTQMNPFLPFTEGPQDGPQRLFGSVLHSRLFHFFTQMRLSSQITEGPQDGLSWSQTILHCGCEAISLPSQSYLHRCQWVPSTSRFPLFPHALRSWMFRQLSPLASQIWLVRTLLSPLRVTPLWLAWPTLRVWLVPSRCCRRSRPTVTVVSPLWGGAWWVAFFLSAGVYTACLFSCRPYGAGASRLSVRSAALRRCESERRSNHDLFQICWDLLPKNPVGEFRGLTVN